MEESYNTTEFNTALRIARKHIRGNGTVALIQTLKDKETKKFEINPKIIKLAVKQVNEEEKREREKFMLSLLPDNKKGMAFVPDGSKGMAFVPESKGGRNTKRRMKRRGTRKYRKPRY
jgi:hypothetical protein